MSRSPVHRKYNLGRRAEQQAETRQRIVEAAVELHGSVGPAQTSLSMVAERAGVQRHTLYAHFPDERSLLMACSGHSMEQDPPPDAEPWLEIEDREKRLRTGLRAIYDWYENGAQLLGCVMRDAEIHPTVREISQLRYGPVLSSWIDVLGAPFNTKQRVMLGLALSFFTWRTLVRDIGLTQAAAVTAMANAIEGTG
jgi:AcrR family transcriptional regulator